MKHIRTKYYNDDRNGQIEWQAEYEGDKRDGLTVWFNEDGSVAERSNWKKDKLDGLFELFNGDVRVRKRSNWKNGVEV